MNKILIFILGFAFLCSCTSQSQRIKEAEIKYEKEAKAKAIAELREWHDIKALALKATGITSSVKEERSLAYVKLIQMFPKLEQWGDIVKSIDREETYSDYEEFLWEIKKAKGWEEIE